MLGSLPNVFSALCLNARGLGSFVQCQPFERLFKVLLSPDYLPAMRRRRSSDPLGESDSLFSVWMHSHRIRHIQGKRKLAHIQMNWSFSFWCSMGLMWTHPHSVVYPWNLLNWRTCYNILLFLNFRWHCIQLGQCCGWAHEAPTNFEDWCYYCHYKGSVPSFTINLLANVLWTSY